MFREGRGYPVRMVRIYRGFFPKTLIHNALSRRKAFCVSLLVAGASANSFASSPAKPQDSFLDARISTGTGLGGHFDSSFLRICRLADRPCGLELRTCKGSRSISAPLIDVGGTTLRQALDRAVHPSSGYQWKVRDGVINVEPIVRSESGLMSRKVGPLSLHDLSSNDAFNLVLATAGIRTGGSFYSGPGPVYGAVDLELNKVTVREALNAIAKADGHVAWSLCVDRPERTINAFYVTTWGPASHAFRPKTAPNVLGARPKRWYTPIIESLFGYPQ